MLLTKMARKFNIKILDWALFWEFFNMLDQADSGDRVSKRVFQGNLEVAWTLLSKNASNIFAPKNFANIIMILVKRGAIKLVADASGLQQAITIGNITIGL